MTERVQCQRLQVAAELKQFIENEVLPGSGIEAAAFWSGFDALVHDLAPRNRALLAERDRLQTELDTWHRANPGPVRDMAAYRAFLESIGYLLPQPQTVKASTANGIVKGHRITLRSVRIQDVEVFDVAAAVLPQPMPHILLGNSFLNRFQMNRQNDTLKLSRRY